VCHGPALAGFERQARLGSVEGLDLGLLVLTRFARQALLKPIWHPGGG
jgi:hypothetical protein